MTGTGVRARIALALPDNEQSIVACPTEPLSQFYASNLRITRLWNAAAAISICTTTGQKSCADAHTHNPAPTTETQNKTTCVVKGSSFTNFLIASTISAAAIPNRYSMLILLATKGVFLHTDLPGTDRYVEKISFNFARVFGPTRPKLGLSAFAILYLT